MHFNIYFWNAVGKGTIKKSSSFDYYTRVVSNRLITSNFRFRSFCVELNLGVGRSWCIWSAMAVHKPPRPWNSFEERMGFGLGKESSSSRWIHECRVEPTQRGYPIGPWRLIGPDFQRFRNRLGSDKIAWDIGPGEDWYSEQRSVAILIYLPSRSAAPPTCLETRTKESATVKF